jgi:hypothetical protein
VADKEVSFVLSGDGLSLPGGAESSAPIRFHVKKDDKTGAFLGTAKQGAKEYPLALKKGRYWYNTQKYASATFGSEPCVNFRDPYHAPPMTSTTAATLSTKGVYITLLKTNIAPALLRAEAIELGKKVFHTQGGCRTCHATYAKWDDIVAWNKELGIKEAPAYRPKMANSEAKLSKFSRSPKFGGGPQCEADKASKCIGCSKPKDCKGETKCKSGICVSKKTGKCRFCNPEDGQTIAEDTSEKEYVGGGGKDMLCTLGRCEIAVTTVPPDFLLMSPRSGSTVNDIFRTLAVGINGTGMASVLDIFVDEPHKLWAVAYYVEWLISIQNTPTAITIKEMMAREEVRVDAKLGNKKPTKPGASGAPATP